jgi:uncharacterized protein YcbX
MSSEPIADPPGPQARITALWIYPVKSCAGVSRHAVRLSDKGLAQDRAWMVVDAEGEMLTQRELPRMALMQPQLDDDASQLQLHAPGMPVLSLTPRCLAKRTVRVWNDVVPAFNEGEAVSDWLTRFLIDAQHPHVPTPLRLVRFDESHVRASSAQWSRGHAAHNRFSDGFPILVVSQASLDALNQRLTQQGEAAVDMRRFRPNLVVAGLDDNAWMAHDEDRVARLQIQTPEGEVVLLPVKPCPRCPIPDIDPDRATTHPSVSRTLQTYRQDARVNGAITFGMNALALQGVGCSLALGQTVQALWAFD